MEADNQIRTPPEPPYPGWLRSMLGDDFFSNVTFVVFHGEEVKDSALESVKGLEQVKCLNLANCQITNEGLEQITGLKKLENLQLSGCKGITDNGVNRLGGLRQLNWIDVSFTNVTDAGIARLQQALPNCIIEH
ncbi:MAG: hypothetical protein IT426_18665 [Pirellulales bacterium]|nr:hypothetical protein [Pirellulales bacterium]